MSKKLNIPKPQKLNSNFIKTPSLIKNNDGLFLLSLQHFDINQGEGFTEWEKKGKLSDLLTVLHGYSQDKLIQRVDKNKFTIYGDFPQKKETAFTYPLHIQEDANWARIHIDGKHCLIGHVVQNIFYIVFLDGSHSFWKSKLKHT